MDVLWETGIFRVTSVFILCSLRLKKKEVSILFLRVGELLFWSRVAFLCYKRLVFTSLSLVLTLLITLLSLQPLRALQPSSQPVQYSAVPYPPPLLPASSAQQYSVVFHLLFSAPCTGSSGAAALCLECCVLPG